MDSKEQIKDEAAETMMCCASCGKSAGDDVKLRKCTACNLVKYCSVECQKNHRKQHKKACKKRAAEIRDNQLFQQPDESHLGECPICCLPLPLDVTKWGINSCCSQRICMGCNHANKTREIEQGQHPKCPFCREPLPKTEKEEEENLMKRAKANDPVAISVMGQKCHDQGDYEGAFENYVKATQLGDIDAHYNLSCMHRKGEGVERNEQKEVYHLEIAAIGGQPSARYNLGYYEGRNGRHERAMKHFIIASKLGHDAALNKLKMGFSHGFVSKDDFEAALRGHQAAVDATKSKQRKDACAFYNRRAS